MSEIRFVLTDLDGTVVLPEAQVASEEVVSSIRGASERGIEFAAVTGRQFEMAKDLLKSLGLQGPSIFEGGAVIIDPKSEEILWSRTVQPGLARDLVEILSQHASVIQYGHGVLKPKDVNLTAITEPVLSIWASVPAQKANEIILELKSYPGIAVHANAGPGGDFSRTGIQITNHEADKGHAVHELLRILEAEKQFTLAIGDGDNDLPLFEIAKLKIAMGNASNKLKAKSDEVVASIDHDGFAEAMHKFAK